MRGNCRRATRLRLRPKANEGDLWFWAAWLAEERDGGGVNPSGDQRGTGCSSSSSSHAAAARRAAEALVDGALLTEEVRKIAITSAVLLKMISWVESWCKLN